MWYSVDIYLFVTSKKRSRKCSPLSDISTSRHPKSPRLISSRRCTAFCRLRRSSSSASSTFSPWAFLSRKQPWVDFLWNHGETWNMVKQPPRLGGALMALTLYRNGVSTKCQVYNFLSTNWSAACFFLQTGQPSISTICLQNPDL